MDPIHSAPRRASYARLRGHGLRAPRLETLMTQEEIRSSFDQKVRKGLFRPVARHILSLADAEDRLQEAVCMTYEMHARYAERGQVLDDAILVRSCKQRATDLGRRFVRDDASQGAM